MPAVLRASLLIVLATVLVGCNAPSTVSNPSSRQLDTHAIVPDPKIGPNAADEARHMGEAVNLPAATNAPMPLLAVHRGLSVPYVATALAPFHREVFGFAPYWAISDESTWNYRLLSTLAYFGLTITRDAVFDTTAPGWNQWNSAAFTDMVNRAHANGDRVVVVVKQFNTEAVNRLVTDPALTQLAIDNTIGAITSKNIDGVNIDFEGQGPSSTYPYIQTGLTTFMTKLSQQVHAKWPNAEVSIDTYSGSASWDGGLMKIGDLAPVVDAMFIMAYDMVFSNQPGVAGANAPLTHYTYNDTTSVTEYLSKAPASKILLGVPYYGYKWSTTGNGPNSTINPNQKGATADTYENIVSELACSAQFRTGGWDAYAQSPYLAWYSPASNDPCDGNFGSWRELYYDSAASLGIKYDLVNQSNLRGAGMWALGYDGGAPELWNEIAQKLTTVTPWDQVGTGLASSDPAAAGGTNRIDAFIRGGDSAVWQSTWDGTSWTAWASLGGRVFSAPAAVSPGRGRLDMFARGGDNRVWHRWWDGTTWHDWESLGGNITSGPEIASWAADHMDLFVRGTDRHLWHRAWNGTQWLAWENLGGILTSDPAAVSYTSGRLDVYVRGGDNAMWRRMYEMGGWSDWQSMGGNLISAPAVASCANLSLDVYAVMSDRALWHIGSNVTSIGTWESLGGQWAGGPAATCEKGASTVDVFERAQDGSVWHSALASS